jgi:L-alanine-DL-glutamate epimerase-like enolase superfamily enzyme
MSVSLRAVIERWPLAQTFAISRGTKIEAVTVTAEISDGARTGRGECVPYARYNETPESVLTDIEAMHNLIKTGLSRADLRHFMPPGAARNAIDCALWDLEAKQAGKHVFELAGLPEPQPLITAFTISLDTPEKMAEAAAKAADWPLLKIKLGQPEDAARLKAIRAAAPNAELIVDANEGWTPDNLAENFAACIEAGVTLIEQPLPAGQDEALARIKRPIPVCADESLHNNAPLSDLARKYDALNIKLDKAGGLTEALKLVEEATHLNFSTMAGCMVGTSLAIAPALLFAQKARVVDLDGPLWLAKDREHGLRYDNHRVYPASKELWG